MSSIKEAYHLSRNKHQRQLRPNDSKSLHTLSAIPAPPTKAMAHFLTPKALILL